MIDLNQLAEQAAQLLVARHREHLLANEVIRIIFTRHKGLRRIQLELHDKKADRLLELFADIPGSAEGDDEEKDEAGIAMGLDFLDGVLAQHLESDRERLPRLEPVAHEFEGRSIHLSGGLRHPFLEAEADRLLEGADEDPAD